MNGGAAGICGGQKRTGKHAILLNDKRTAALKILIVVDKPRDALELVRHVPGIPCVNIGNFGRVGDRRQRRPLTDNFSASEEELNSCGKSRKRSAARFRFCRRCPKRSETILIRKRGKSMLQNALILAFVYYIVYLLDCGWPGTQLGVRCLSPF